MCNQKEDQYINFMEMYRNEYVSISTIQRNLGYGYPKAKSFLKELIDNKLVVSVDYRYAFNCSMEACSAFGTKCFLN
ncbi:MAG: hypothetical protein IKB42_01455 [Clostridia bacterium]|nr:hypothetical protein [Clostridia bacterium]